jgi:hypothetical protein
MFKHRRFQWTYLASLGFAGVFMALMNAPSGYAPFLCGAGMRNVPCLSYSYLDQWPQFITAGMWFFPIAVNVVALVLLFEVGSNEELIDTAIWLLGILGAGIVYIFVHHWQMLSIDRGIFIDAPGLHRWSISGLTHYAFEYSVIPLAFAGLVVVLPTWIVRARRLRRKTQTHDVPRDEVSSPERRRAFVVEGGQS